MISILILCVPLLGVLFIGVGGVIYWQDSNNKVIAGIIAGIGILIFICTIAGLAINFMAAPQIWD